MLNTGTHKMRNDTRIIVLLESLALLILLSACGESKQVATDAAELTPSPADRVFLNAAVYTVDADRSWAEAVAVREGEIVFVGANDAAST